MNKSRIFVHLSLLNRLVKTLIDSSVTRNIIFESYVKKFNVSLIKKTKFYYMRTINKNQTTKVQYEIKSLWIRNNEHKERIIFDVIKTQRDIYLDIFWLNKWNSKIEWATMRVKIENHLLNVFKRLIELKRNLNFLTRKWRIKKKISIKNEVSRLFQKFREVLKKSKRELSLSTHITKNHEIILTNSKKLKVESIYELNDEQSNVLRKYIDHNLAKEYIRHFKFKTKQSIMFVSKKSREFKLCVDFKRVNAITQKNKYSLSLLANLKSKLEKTKWFIKLNLRDVFNFFKIKTRNEWEIAFKTKYELFEYLMMSFELINAFAILQRVVNKTLYDYLDIFVIVYMNDVLIFSKTKEKHEQHIVKVLKRFQEHNLKVKEEKSKFFKQEVTFLEYVIQFERIEMKANKLKAIKKWSISKNKKDIQSFLNFIEFYQNMTKEYAKKIVSLTNLLRNDTRFEWTRLQNETLKNLKRDFATKKVLKIYDSNENTFLFIDAFDRALESCIVQKEKPLEYYFKKLTLAKVNYITTDKEMLVIIANLVYWKIYIQEAKKNIIVYTNHKNLLSLLHDKELNQRQLRWTKKITHYDFEIKHIKEIDNTIVDTLNRRANYEATKKIFRSLLRKNEAMLERAKASKKICDIIRQVHDSKTSKHQDVIKTLKRMQKTTNMHILKKHVEKYIKNCSKCAMTKTSRLDQIEKFQLLKLSKHSYQNIALNFIIELSKSKDFTTKVTYDMIMIVIDEFTKHVKFISCKITMTAKQLAFLLLRTIFFENEISKKIISNKNKLFTFKFMKRLTQAFETKQAMSIFFHSQTNEQTKRMNQTLKTYLRIYCSNEKEDWVKLLFTTQMTINFSYNENMRITLNELLHERIIKQSVLTTTFNLATQSFANKMKSNWNKIKVKLKQVKKKMKQRVNTKRRDHEIQEEDKILLSIKNLTNKKLNKSFIEIFQVEKINDITTTLKLSNTEIFLKFHVELLKKALARTFLIKDWFYERKKKYEIEYILDERTKTNEFLIKWKSFSNEKNTWKLKKHLKHAQEVLRKFKKAT